MLGTHPLGLYEKALDPSLFWADKLKTAQALGFDYIEICIDEDDSRLNRLYCSDSEIEQMRRDCFEIGIPVRTMCLSGHRKFPFGSSDPETREKAREIMRLAIRFAAKMGIRVIQLAGYDVYYETSTEESLRLFLEGMRSAVEMASREQVMLALEIMDTPLYCSITKFLALKEQIGSPWFTVYPDTGNLTAWGNDVAAEFQKGIDDIVAVHLKDTLAVTDSFPGKFKNVPFGTGCVDFAFCFQTLHQLGYHGPFLIEMWYDPHTDYLEQIMVAKTFIEQKYASIR